MIRPLLSAACAVDRRRGTPAPKPLPHRRHVPGTRPRRRWELFFVQTSDEGGHLVTTRRRSGGKCRPNALVERVTCVLLAGGCRGSRRPCGRHGHGGVDG